MVAWTVCDGCSNPVAFHCKGYYRCRQCGYESLRDSQPYSRSEREYVEASIAHEQVESDGRGEAAPALGLSP